MFSHPGYVFVGLGGVAVGTSGYFMRWRMIEKLRNSEFYKLATANFLAHTPLMNLIGEPVHFGKSQFGMNNEEFSDGMEARYCIPFTGTKTSGKMIFEATRNPDDPTPRWRLKYLHAETKESKPDRVLVPIRFLTIDKVPSNYLTPDKNNETPIVQPSPSPAPAAS